MADPSFWQFARKCVWAIAVGVVVAGGTITAAVADEHVTLSEGVAIVLAVLGAVAGPVGVYRAKNAPKPAPRPVLAVPAAPTRRPEHLGQVPPLPPDRDTRPWQ
jgi:hypothetical protein